jgi:hypothetical protein
VVKAPSCADLRCGCSARRYNFLGRRNQRGRATVCAARGDVVCAGQGGKSAWRYRLFGVQQVPTSPCILLPIVSGAFQPENMGFMVLEELPYVVRQDVQRQIVESFARRATLRKQCPGAASDKASNAMTVLPATRGLGKSTELAHFPASDAYRSYAMQGENAPVVSVVTYNSGMNGGTLSVGVRIIFGAIRSMGLTECAWTPFEEEFGHIKTSALDAVQLLHGAFGAQRRVLVCVDELSQAGPDDQAIMAELGSLLADDGDCDVLVTSLSLHYIERLLRSSQRAIDFIPILPLPSDASLPPLDACVEAILSNFGEAQVETMAYKTRLMRSVQILASGHPRTLAYLGRKLRETVVVAELSKALENSRTTPFQFLRLLCDVVGCAQSSLVQPTELGHARLVLSTGKYLSSCEILRSAVDDSVVQLFGPKDYGLYRVSTTLALLLQLAGRVCNPFHLLGFPKTQYRTPAELDRCGQSEKAIAALGTLLGGGQAIPDRILPTLWERCRMLSTIMRVIDGQRTFKSITGGAVSNTTLIVKRYEGVEFARGPGHVRGRAEYRSGVLVIPIAGQGGCDAVLLGEDWAGQRAVLYEGIDVSATDKVHEAYPNTVARKLCVALCSHFVEERTGTLDGDHDEVSHFKRIAFLFTRYVDEERPSQSDVLTQVVAERALGTGTPADWDRVERYATQVWEQNVGFLNKAGLQQSMIPSTLPVADLVQQVGRGADF